MDPFMASGRCQQRRDIGRRLISGSIEHYRAADGASSANNNVEYVARDLVFVCALLVLKPRDMELCLRSESEATSLLLVDSCRMLGLKVLKILESLKVKVRHRRWESAHQALRTAWKAKDVQRYEKQLDSTEHKLLSVFLRYWSKLDHFLYACCYVLTSLG